MIHVLLPYYNEDSEEFKKSIDSQTYKDFEIIRRDRKKDKIYWTKAMREFKIDFPDDDIICVMNNDVEFSKKLFEIASKLPQKSIYLPYDNSVRIDWKDKKFTQGSLTVNGFYGRCFFMHVKDYKQLRFSRLLPHYLADLDFSLKALKKLYPLILMCHFKHPDHPRKEGKFILNSDNPIFWTIFLLKHFNRYTLKNILLCWITLLN